MARLKRPRNPTSGTADRALRSYHALAPFQGLINLANEKITSDNWAHLVCLGKWPQEVARSLIGANLTIAGHQLAECSDPARYVREMQEAVQAALRRAVNGERADPAEPVRFIIGGRQPFQLVPPREQRAGRPRVPLRSTAWADPVSGQMISAILDVQDLVHQQLVALLAALRKREPMRFPGSGQGYPFRPLARCASCEHLYFRSRADKETCSAICKDKLKRQRLGARRAALLRRA